MANGRPTGDGSDRSPERRRGKAANQEGLAALGRQMRTGPEGESVANESGLRALGARSTRSRAKPKGVRRSGKPKWSTRQEGGGVALRVDRAPRGRRRRRLRLPAVPLRPDQQGAHQRRGGRGRTVRPSPSSSSARTAGSGSRQPGVRLGLGGHRPAQRRRAAVAGHAVDQADPDPLHPARHGRLHAAARRVAVRHLQPDQLLLQLGRQPAGARRSPPTSGFRSTTSSRSTSPDSRTPSTRWAASTSTSPTRPRTPTPASTSRRPAASCSTAPRPWPWLGPATTSTTQDGYWQYDGTSDFGRIQRQDAFLKAMITRGQVEGEPAHGQRLHRLHPRGHHDRRRVRPQRAHRAGARPTTRSTRPTCRRRRCPRWLPTPSGTWVTC